MPACRWGPTEKLGLDESWVDVTQVRSSLSWERDKTGCISLTSKLVCSIDVWIFFGKVLLFELLTKAEARSRVMRALPIDIAHACCIPWCAVLCCVLRRKSTAVCRLRKPQTPPVPSAQAPGVDTL